MGLMKVDLIRRELRSLLPLIAITALFYFLAFICLTIVFPDIFPPTKLHTLQDEGGDARCEWHWGLYPPFVNSWLNTILFFLNLYFATTLALLQTRKENTIPDSDWKACTLHRICVGAGLLLSFNLLLIMVVAVHSAWPGIKPFPFLWDFVVDSLRFAFSGITLYLCTFWLSLRKARWYGSRLFPWIMGFVLMSLNWRLPIGGYYVVVIGLIVVVWPLLALLNEVNRITTDPRLRMVAPIRTMISSFPGTMLLGVGVVPFLMVLVIVLVTSSYTYDNSADRSESLYLRSDGAFLVRPRHWYSSDPVPSRDLFTGQEVPYLEGSSVDSGNVLLPQLDYSSQYQPWGYRIRETSGPEKAEVLWYLVHDGEKNGHAVLMGYDVESCRVVGYIGREGYSDSVPSTSKQFLIEGKGRDPISRRVFAPIRDSFREPDWLGVSFIWTEDGLYRVDTQQRETSRIVEWASGEQILSVKQNSHTQTIHAEAWRVLACTSTRVIEIDINGGMKEILLPVALQGVDHLEIFKGQTGSVLVSQTPISFATNEIRVLHRIYNLNKVGILETTPEVTLTNYFNQPPMFGPELTIALVVGPVLAATGLLSPMASDKPIYDWWDRWRSPEVVWSERKRAFGWMFTLGFLSALIAFCWEGWHGGRWITQLGWSLFVFLFGLIGLAGYLVHRPWRTTS
jgi:hypothetical protein